MRQNRHIERDEVIRRLGADYPEMSKANDPNVQRRASKYMQMIGKQLDEEAGDRLLI